MKTKFSKRLISILLSLLMVVTSIPAFTMTASAAINTSYQKHLLYGNADGVNTVGGAYYNESQSALEIGSSGKYGTVNVQELFQNTNSSQGFTISFRAKSDSNVADQGRYFTINQSYGYNAMNWNASKNVAYIDLWSTNKIEIASSRNDPNLMSEGSTTATKGAWHIYTVTVANSTVKMYIDGTQKFTINAGGCNYDSFFNQMKNSANTQLIIGGTSWNGDAQFSGYIGQVNLYNKALSAEEVVTDMNDIEKDYNSYNEKVTAFSGNFTNNGTGLAISGTESRWSNNQMNIVNDQQANNTDAGIIRYDISKIKGMAVESAKLNYKVDSWSADTVTTGLTFYYSTSISNTSYINNSETKSTGWSCGSGTTANNSFATGLGFSTSNTLGVVSKGLATSNTQMDIKTALQKAADENASYLYVIIMQTTAGGSGSNSGWSDTKITPANFTIDYSVKRKEYTRAQVASVKSNLTDTKLNNAPYQGNMANTQDGSYSKSSLVGGDQMSNVLYSYGVGGNSAFVERGDDDWWNAGIQFGAVTLLYDGEHDMAFPVNYFIKRTTSWNNGTGYSRQPVSVYVDSNYVQLNHIWHGLKSDGAGYASSTTYGVNIVNSKTASNPGGYDMPPNEQDYYSNTLYIRPENLTFNNNLAEIAGIKFNFYVNQTGKNQNKTGNVTTKTDGSQSIRVINYKPVHDAIKKGKEIYNTVSANEYAYCSTDLYNFYNALDKLCSFNPNNYFAKDNNGYQACVNALNALEEYIDVVKTTPTTSDWSYTHSYTDGQTNSAVKHTMVCSKCGEEVEENCTWNAGDETTPATCTADGLKTYTCTNCNGTYVETIPMSEHNWGAWNGSFSSTKHTRQCQDCEKWDEYVECDHKTLIPGKAATCTETGLTDGYACSVCGVTRVAQKTIPMKEHNWGAWDGSFSSTYHGRQCTVCKTWEPYEDEAHKHNKDKVLIEAVAATCTTDGRTAELACSVCDRVMQKSGTINATGHTETAPVEENRVEAKCTTDGSYDSVVYCSVCKVEVSREQKVIPATGVHSYTGESVHTDAEGDANGYTEYRCVNGCNELGGLVYDTQNWDAYNSAVAQIVKNNDDGIYTDESFEKYSEIVNGVKDNVKTDDPTKSQAYIDAKTSIIISALSVLRTKHNKVTFHIFDEKAEKNLGDIEYNDVEYGTSLTLTVPDEYSSYGVSKWVKTNEVGVDSRIGSTSSSIIAIINASVEYTVYLYDTAESKDDQAVTLIMYNNSNRPTANTFATAGASASVSIVGDKIKIGDSDALQATKYAFYDVVGFTVNGKAVEDNGSVALAAGSTVIIKPIYKAKGSFIITLGGGVDTTKYPEEQISAGWDQTITLTSTGDNTVWKVDGKVVAQGTKYTFKATKACTIMCVANESTEAPKPIATVDYLTYGGYRDKTITAVGHYFVPEGYTFVSSGMLLKTDVNSVDNVKTVKENFTSGKGKFEAKNIIKSTKQFTINVYASKQYDQIFVGAVAYVTCEKDGVQTTFYSDSVTTFSYSQN